MKLVVEAKPSNIGTKAVKRRQEGERHSDAKLFKRRQALAEFKNGSNQPLVYKEASKLTRKIMALPCPYVKPPFNKKRSVPKKCCESPTTNASRKSFVKGHSLEFSTSVLENQRKPKVKSYHSKRSVTVTKRKPKKEEVFVMPLDIFSWHRAQKGT